MATITFEKIIIPYQREELNDWKTRDPRVVPSHTLNWNGPGVINGYGYGEWKAEQYFRQHGYYVFNNDFNLLSKKSKFERFNQCILSMIDSSKIKTFQKTVQELIKEGYSIENPDLFVFSLEDFFFAEVKKEKDTLREPQVHFMYLAKQIFGTESKLVYLSDIDNTVRTEIITEDLSLPSWIKEIQLHSPDILQSQ
ncbi:hypothetical protein V7124_19870 [Neobacillus niacini]|uniref:hypothetical protein n=1 Tax=Neobacillus niacini TaxID=86668 RepID=UPI002FFFD56A